MKRPLEERRPNRRSFGQPENLQLGHDTPRVGVSDWPWEYVRHIFQDTGGQGLGEKGIILGEIGVASWVLSRQPAYTVAAIST